MSFYKGISACAFLAVAFIVGGAQAAEMYRPGVVLIKLKPQAANTVGASKRTLTTGVASLDQLHVQLDIRGFERTVPSADAARDASGLSRFYTVSLPIGISVDDAISAYAADPNVEVAEPDYIMPLEMVPDDPDYGQQWTHFSPVNNDIDTQQAWDLEVGDSTVTVGVIDSGIQHDHPDLKAAVWVNPGEDLDGDGVPWDASDMDGLDSDFNGLVDDLIGWDFMPLQGGCAGGEDCNGPDNNPADFAGHGTHTNGIVGAVTDNAIGVAGVAGGERGARRPGVKLMGLRAGYQASNGNGFVIMSACASACDYAVAKGVDVINCSWGSSGTIIRNAILNAVANGVVVCKSAGNDTSDVPDIIDTTFGVLAVASLYENGSKSDFSNYGAWVDISAPGSAIYNTYSNAGAPVYATLSGTSMAAPTVAGVAALLKSHHPSFTKTQIDTLLMNYAVNIDAENPGFIGQLGSGRVNALNSLSILTTADFTADVAFGFAPHLVNFTNASPNAPTGPYTYTYGDASSGPGPNASHLYANPGIYSVTFTGSGPSGPHTRVRPEMIVVVRDTIEYGNVSGLAVGNMVPVPVRLNNTHAMIDVTLPVKLTGTPGVVLDSLVLTPLTANWNVQKVFETVGATAWRIRALTTGQPIPAGGGIIANVWIRVTSGSSGVEIIDSATLGASQHTLRLISSYANFKPRFVAGSATLGVPCDCSCHGDPNCDGVATVIDVVSVINEAFRGQAGTSDASCPHVGRADINCDCAIDVIDVVSIVNRAFRGDNSPQCDQCIAPCF